MNESSRQTRREFVRYGTFKLTAASLCTQHLFANEASIRLRVGLVTDLHYADKPSAGTRHYKESLAKLEEAALRFEQEKPDFVVELGDLIDSADSVKAELGHLKAIDRKFSAICKNRHYVLGNHCVDTLRKEEFLGSVGQEKSYYSFDRGGVHFIVLDSCFRSDGEPYGRKNFQWTDTSIPPAEIEWLEADLKANRLPVIVFAHQRLDVTNDHGVKNNVVIRGILESNGHVLAVFQGHSHTNDLKEINGIHYCTLVAMVEGSGKESSGYSLLEIEPNGTIQLTGFRKQKSHDWPR
jgi:predicted phosphodiesterase